MSIQVGLHHHTVYAYDRPVRMSPQTIRLRPAPHTRVPVLSYSLKVEPSGHFLNWQQDPFSNWQAGVVFPDPVRRFEVTVDLIAEWTVINPFDFFLAEHVETWPFRYKEGEQADLQPYLRAMPPGPRLAAFLAEIPRDEQRTVSFLVDINTRLNRAVDYIVRMEPGVFTPEETLERGRGSCRDSAWLLVQILRTLGLAARFVSGYLIQLTPDVKPLEGPAGTDHDFTDLHAWTEVYLPGAGWVGMDPTSGLFAGEGHIPLAATPEPSSAAPITGAVEKSEVAFDFSMKVERLHETPRVTKPYGDRQWRAIDALGHAVDARLKDGDVRLTMGGEPTFVSIDDMDGEEWTVAATGPDKKKLAEALICRLRERFAPDGLLTLTHGKWYPGESLPRWAFSLFWRGDGKPLWGDSSLIALEAGDVDAETSERFTRALARRLGVDEDCVQPAFEDPLPYVADEQRLPSNVDPLDARLSDTEERARLARVLEVGLGKPIGHVLPVQRWQARDGAGWMSEKWEFRRKRLFLVPGDHAIGYRLPLKSLPWIAEEDYPHVVERDPFAPRGPLPDPTDRTRRQAHRLGVHPPSPEAIQDIQLQRAPERRKGTGPGSERPVHVRTALCVEPRDGALNVFIPPLESAEDYLDMLAVVEDTARELNQPIRIEGYDPPRDQRLNVIKVTPDPGVIEVNIHPSDSWAMLCKVVEALYEEARLSRLGTEKFMIDGRHVGTGGGNHVVVGGPSAPDSPFLRRPDVLGSLIRYWQHHPSLSYLFSGLFIGPTSQAPRVDEARDDVVHELDLALSLLPPKGTDSPPWLVDRILRNLLTDVSGNTHRTEICVDKLYSPDGPAGRLGLVEFRSFEMPPHARMSLAQQLLLRALIAWFWETPYTRPLVRWGNALHDRFMLPHFVEQDFRSVLDELNRAGFAFDPEWYAPHVEFRFPLVGRVVYDSVAIEVRQALEPWPVLGEEPAAGGTVRYVDSSLERLQVKMTGGLPGRHALTCNERRIPLHPTGRPGESVAGVRYRAWQPAECLHPTIGVHAPLVFDLVDEWNERALGGCTYHVAHPGGRSHETFPVNGYEAEGRRLARFQPFGHTPGRMVLSEAVINPDFPFTLDMRLNHPLPDPI